MATESASLPREMQMKLTKKFLEFRKARDAIRRRTESYVWTISCTTWAPRASTSCWRNSTPPTGQPDAASGFGLDAVGGPTGRTCACGAG